MANLDIAVLWQKLATSNILAAGCGLLTHSVLNHGEWDHESHILVCFWITAFVTMSATTYWLAPVTMSVIDSACVSVGFAIVYFATLGASISIYRVFFHPLRKFPGPFFARVTKMYSVGLVVDSNHRYYSEIEKLHKSYQADIIRTGPRELSVTRTDAIPLIHGAASKCIKGPFYSGAHHIEGCSLQTSRDKLDHRQRRKLWDCAFSVKSLRDYEIKIDRHSQTLMQQLIEKADDASIRISSWVNYFSFDAMGDIGFSRSFGMLEAGQEDEVIKALHENLAPLSVLFHVIWILPILSRIRIGVKPILDFTKFSSQVLRQRKKITPAEADVFSWLLDPEDEGIPFNLNADARLLVIAGSDTTAATLTCLLYELCRDRNVQAKLRKEIDQMECDSAFLRVVDLNNCPYMDAVINETLRLHPPVPSGVQRETPPSGLTLPDGTFIPGSTVVMQPTYTMHRDPRYFASPLDFMPDRWTEEAASAVLDKRAFMPFGTGVYNCVGQKLAMLEMRSVVANLVRTFDIEFAPGEDGSTFEKECRDCFTLNVGKLDVRLRARGEKKEKTKIGE